MSDGEALDALEQAAAKLDAQLPDLLPVLLAHLSARDQAAAARARQGELGQGPQEGEA